MLAKTFFRMFCTVLLTSWSCHQIVEPNIRGTYIYLNETDVNLSILAFNEANDLIHEMTIPPGGRDSLVSVSRTGGAPFVFGSSDSLVTDSLALRFGDDLCTHFLNDGETCADFGPLCVQNYEGYDHPTSDLSVIYRFTNELLQEATECR